MSLALPAGALLTRSPTVAGNIDVHQHLWPPELVEALRRRTSAPRMVGWTLLLDGEPPYHVDPGAHDIAARSRIEHDGGADLVILSLSSPLGIEDLPGEEANQLLRAWHEGVRALPDRFRGWAAVRRRDPDLDELESALLNGFAGLQIPATWLATPAALEHIAPTLDVARRTGRPVLIHPGPVATSAGDVPGWWPAVVDYPAQLHAAWWSWTVAGRALLPGLRICFAAGAGLAPIQHERYTARGGGRVHIDDLTFVDTSSYSRQGLDALIRVLGVDQLVMGSDCPYAEPTDPGLGAAATRAIRSVNPLRLLEGNVA